MSTRSDARMAADIRFMQSSPRFRSWKPAQKQAQDLPEVLVLFEYSFFPYPTAVQQKKTPPNQFLNWFHVELMLVYRYVMYIYIYIVYIYMYLYIYIYRYACA